MSLTKPSEKVAVLAKIDPASVDNTEAYSEYVDMAKWEQAMAIIMVGTFAATATVDGRLLQAQDDQGTGEKIVGSAITQLTDADDNKQIVLNLNAQQLDRANGFTHIRLEIDVTTAACIVAGVVLGLEPKFSPASDYDAATVDEIVN